MTRKIARSTSCSSTLLRDQDESDTQELRVPENQLSPDQSSGETHTAAVGAELIFCAEFLNDVEKIRVATENRLEAMLRAGVDARPYEGQLKAFERIEDEAVLALRRVLRRHPLGPWVKAQKGVGEKQGARLIAAIGTVSWNHLEDRPRRGPNELWAYCGYAPGQKRQRGVKSNWNADAKMRAFLVAGRAAQVGVRKLDGCDDTDGYDVEHRESITPLAAVYLKARQNWADREVKDGHKHNHALRLVAKEVLKDLFVEARRLGA
jgi:hypothetical protein